MQILVTGGAGFIGVNLCHRLVAEGHAVTVVDRLDDARSRTGARLLAARPGPVRVVRADLGTADLRPLLDGVDAVVHLAGRPGVQSSWGTGFADHLRGNVAVSQRLLEATLDVGIGRMVLASSSSVYGEPQGGPVVEDRPPAPVSPYGATKASMELLARTYAARGVPAVCLRYFTVYGRLQRPDMAIHRILRAGLTGHPFSLRGDGHQVRDFTHVDDVTRATSAAISAALPDGEVLNVGSGRPVALRAVITACEELLGAPVPVATAAAAPGDPASTSADITRAGRLLGWHPEVPLLEGLADQLAWQRTGSLAAAVPVGVARR